MSTPSAAFEIQRILVPTANWQLGSNCSNNYNTHTHAHAHTHTPALSDKNALPTFAGFESVAIAKRRNYLCAAYCVCNLYAYNAHTRTHIHTHAHTHIQSCICIKPPRPCPVLTPLLFMLHISCISFVLPTYQASCPATRTPRCFPNPHTTACPHSDPPHPHAYAHSPTPTTTDPPPPPPSSGLALSIYNIQ